MGNEKTADEQISKIISMIMDLGIFELSKEQWLIIKKSLLCAYIAGESHANSVATLMIEKCLAIDTKVK